MPAPTISKIRSKMFIASFRRATSILEGEYASFSKGRSLEFDELREYVPGDNITDIDWKASARSVHPLVKQYNSDRRQPVTFIIDTGRSMEALTGNGSARKKEVSAQILGVLGFLALRHSDSVGLIYGNHEQSFLLPHRETERHLNRLLRTMFEATTVDTPAGGIAHQLEFASNKLFMRGITVIVSGDSTLTPGLETSLNKLGRTQEILWVSVEDVNPLNVEATVVQDIETEQLIPDFMRNNKKLKTWFEQEENTREQVRKQFMSRRGITYAEFDAPDKVIPGLIRMLQRRALERR